MANTKSTFFSEVWRFNLYKKNQGKLTRQLTWVALAAVAFIGCWRLSQGPLFEYETPVRVGIPVVLAVVCAWIFFRMMNYPRIADFLISVEAEMDKVSWASWDELKRATGVVLSTMLFLGVVLFLYDYLWTTLFRALDILQL